MNDAVTSTHKRQGAYTHAHARTHAHAHTHSTHTRMQVRMQVQKVRQVGMHGSADRQACNKYLKPQAGWVVQSTVALLEALSVDCLVVLVVLLLRLRVVEYMRARIIQGGRGEIERKRGVCVIQNNFICTVFQLTHSLTPSLTHLLTQSLTQSLTHSLIYLLAYLEHIHRRV
jgi:hypothetical protein